MVSRSTVIRVLAAMGALRVILVSGFEQGASSGTRPVKVFKGGFKKSQNGSQMLLFVEKAGSLQGLNLIAARRAAVLESVRKSDGH